VEALARYTVELSRPEGGWRELQQTSTRARQAAEEIQGEGKPVRFLRAIFVPEDDVCLFLYEGPSAEVVREAASRAQLRAPQVRNTIAAEEELGI
jgi:hypothetical protein